MSARRDTFIGFVATGALCYVCAVGGVLVVDLMRETGTFVGLGLIPVVMALSVIAAACFILSVLYFALFLLGIGE